MGGFDNDDFGDLSDGYDPYDDETNLTWETCKYGSRFTSAGYCCHKCWVEEKKRMEQNQNNFDFYFDFGDKTEDPPYTSSSSQSSYNNNDWNIMKLTPPKTLKELKKQYRKLCLKYHPDKVGGSGTKFIELTNSYENLCAVC